MIRLSESIVASRPLVLLVGPTAVGKSAIALRLARALDTDIVTADSRQIYRGMDIATDKPTREQQDLVPHRLIDLVDPDQRFNAGDYRRLALEAVERLYGQRRLPLVVGGTGLYVRTLVHGLCDAPPADQAYRAALVQEARTQGPRFLHSKLRRVDPEQAERLHPHDEIKIIRALEVQHLAGRRLSEMQREHRFSWQPFSVLMIGLNRDRECLYRRIDERVENMFQRGLVDETAALLAKGYGRELSAMKGLGYRQIANYLAGEYDQTEARRLLKRDTRHFAKRQLTWFRKEAGLHWWSVTEDETPDLVSARLFQSVQAFVEDLRNPKPGALPPPAFAMGTGSPA